MAKVDAARAIKYLQSTWKNPCPMCGAQAWGVNEFIYELREYKESAVIVGEPSPILPVIAVICNNCGNTIFVNAIKANLLDSSEESQNGK
jgi:hypothetical protein